LIKFEIRNQKFEMFDAPDAPFLTAFLTLRLLNRAAGD
jgi:hypothetical protein